MRAARSIVVAFFLSFAVAAAISRAIAQTAAAQVIEVKGKPMRFRAAGLSSRIPGKPIVVLEAGAAATLDTWQQIFDGVASRAPTIAYDRRGLGGSAVDDVPQTLERVAQSLHDLLKTINAVPPYVLVGHSWGSAFVKSYASRFPTEVAGLVYLEATDFDVTHAETNKLAKGATESVFNLPPIPENISPGLRAEFEGIKAAGQNDFAALRTLRPPTSIPIAVAVAGGKGPTPGASQEIAEGLLRLQIQHQSEWALASSDGLFVVSRKARHQIHTNDPELVLQVISHVISHAH
jgi:pimeloyl-ACP methyl ester carboxylesterase